MRDLGLTLAGGGNRSFYQQALLLAWGERLWDRVAAVSCVSAGAAFALLTLSGRADQARLHWDGLRRGITKNVDWTRALRGERVAPHGRIYRATLVHGLSEGGLERIQSSPFPIWVLCAIPPRGLPIGVSTWLGLGAYSMEKKWAPTLLHPRVGKQLGFKEFVQDARECTSVDELADLVMASSSTPPFTPVGAFRGHTLLDGGIIDNVPAEVTERHPDVRRNLILLTRPYPAGVTGERGQRLYLEPSSPIPIHRWDYTELAAVDATLELGRADASQYGGRLDAWLAAGSAPAAPAS
ncbi:MAG: patatin-like phospholipase family protein [Polyangiales bacterium]